MKRIIFLIFAFCLNFYGVKAQKSTTYTPLKTFKIPVNTPTNLVAISANKKYLAVTSFFTHNYKYWLWVFDIETQKLLFQFSGHPQQIQSIAFSSDNKYLISSGGYLAGENIFIFDLEKQNNPQQPNYSEPNLQQEAVTGLAILPDNSGFYVGCLNGNVAYSPLNSNANIYKSVPSFNGKVIYDIAISPTGKYIAMAGNENMLDGKLLITNLSSSAHTINVEKQVKQEDVMSVAFNANEKYVLGLTSKKKVLIYNIETEQRDVYTPKRSFEKIKLHPKNPDIFYALHSNNDIVSYNINTMDSLKTIAKFENNVKNFAISEDGEWLIAGDFKGNIFIYPASKTKIQEALEEMPSYINQEMKLWLEKGKFEKSSDFNARVTPANQQKQAQIFVQEYLNKIFQEASTKIKKTEYDADNESFKISFQDIEDIILPVPLKEAENFDEAAMNNQLTFEEAEFGFNAQKLVFKKVKISINHTKKHFIYDNQNAVRFQNYVYKPIEVNFNTQPIKQEPIKINEPVVKDDEIIDIENDIPQTNHKNPNAVAVVIGNAKYQKTQSVDFAVRDAQLIKKYLIQTMGFSEKNIIYVENASYIDFKLIFGSKENHKGKLFNIVKPNISDVFVYYSGHGAPGLNDKKAYFVPVETDPQYIELTGFETEIMYDNLAKLPAKSVTVVLDACFSGENLYKNISPIVIKSKGALGLKNGGLLASAAADQVSTWYNEKRYSMFTYFFLKAIHNKNADKNRDNKLTLQEIFDFTNDNAEGVPYYARRLHNIQQNPTLRGQNVNKILVQF